MTLWLVAMGCRPASATDRAPPSPPLRAPSAATSTAVPASAAPASKSETPAASAASAAPIATTNPFGLAAPVARYTCPSVVAGGPFRASLAPADTRVSFVDGDDLLALVNRSPTGALSPSYAPSDLVDVRDGTARSPSQCESAHACLRREAAAALGRMLEQMRREGLRGIVQSAFRGFGTQCWVFAGWARQAAGGFCEATAQSALPGHSQHQLGTTVDMFTTEWAELGAKTGQGVFRNGFGCTAGGRWFDENGWRYGFVVPYPIDPDDRKDGSRCLPRSDHVVPIDPKTGYKHEPWHLRFVGVEAAERYHDAWLASGPGSPREITLEQWLRAQRGLAGDAELPVCDGCSCGACATMAGEGDKSPCGDASLRLDATGRVAAPAEPPTLVDAHATATADGSVVVDVALHVPPHTPTQTPVTTAEGPTYREGDGVATLVPFAESQSHAYPDLPGAWRVGIEPAAPRGARWPFRAALCKPELASTWNRANLVLPARAGDSIVRVRVVVPAGTDALSVALLRDGEAHDVRRVPVP